MKNLRSCGPLAAVLLVAGTTGALCQAWTPTGQKPDPIVLEKSGGFIIGGQHANINPAVTNRTLSCDHISPR